MMEAHPQLCIEMRMITAYNFTPAFFRAFLLETIFDEVLRCELHRHNAHLYLTAIGKLMDDYFLVQSKSADSSFERLQIIYLPPVMYEKFRGNDEGLVK